MKLRWLEADLTAWLERDDKPVLVLTGARQVGKTTLARSVVDAGFEFVALDDPILREELSRVDSYAFARRYPRAVLDEVQKCPRLVEVVKAIVDRGGEERYLLLGSSHVLLLDRVRESLVGRTRLRRLWPLAMAEMLSDGERIGERPAPAPALVSILEAGLAEEPDGVLEVIRQLPSTLALHPLAPRSTATRDRLLQVGGMPALWPSVGEPGEDAVREELTTYTTLYLERDLADLARLRDLEPFVRLQRLAAERTSSMLNTSELARDAGISTATAKNYLRYLELSFQVQLLPPYYSNPAKRLVKSPCLHWTDVGIWRAVTRRFREVSGPLYESAMVAEVAKTIDAFRLPWEMFHLRTYDQREIDLLLTAEDRVIAFEMKSADRVHRQDARHLRETEPITGRRLLAGIVVYRGRGVIQLDERIWAIPDALLFAPPSGQKIGKSAVSG